MKGGQILLVALAGIGTGFWLSGKTEFNMVDVFGLLPSSPNLSGILPTFGAQGQPRQAPQQRGGSFGLQRGGEPGMPVTEQEWRTQAAPYDKGPPAGWHPGPGPVCYYAGNGRCQDGRSMHDLWHGQGGAR